MNYNADDCVLTFGGGVVEGYAEEDETLESFYFRVGDKGSFKTNSGYNVEFVITDIKKDAEC